MGWSQTEPNTRVKHTAYNHFYYGDEAQHRVDEYNALEKTVDELRTKMDADKADAFYQLVYYPVVGAAEMNKKFLYNDKAWLYAKQNRISAYNYLTMAKQAYQRIEQETAFYNEDMAKGKWKGMMSFKSRGLAVFDMPVAPIVISKKQNWGIAPEGVDTTATADFKLPIFNGGLKQAHFIDLFLSDSTTVDWRAEPSAAWINVSGQSGKLATDQFNSQTRLWVSINWDKAPQSAQFDGVITFTGAGRSYKVKVSAMRAPGNFKGFMESDGYVSVFASHYTDLVNKNGVQWQLVNGLGHTGDAMMTPVSAQAENVLEQSDLKDKASCLSYDFYTYSEASPKVILYALPTLPLNRSTGVRCAVSIDGGPLQTVDFKANSVSRTEEWKQNVLSNQAVRKVDCQSLKAGKHTLKIFAIDQGVVLDRMLIDLGGLKPAYSVIAETR